MNNLDKYNHIQRQLDILPPKVLGQRINIIGAGAVGSFLALLLAKSGFSNIYVWDDDKVSVENMSCQFFRFDDIGKFKCDAIRDLVKSFTRTTITTFNTRYEGGSLDGITVAAVDSMAARRMIFESHKRSWLTRAVIDPRMGAEEALVFTYNPHNKESSSNYEKTLYSDDAAVQERCTEKATTYTASMLAGQVTKIIKDIVTDRTPPHSIQWSIKHNDYEAYTKES